MLEALLAQIANQLTISNLLRMMSLEETTPQQRELLWQSARDLMDEGGEA